MAPPIEISIPTTSVASLPDSKPFTQFNITLRLPLRSYVVQKRYSDFSALHDSLTNLAGAAPPVSLPAKHWFQSTVSSPALTESRRAGLETYLRAIAESPDRRWRDTPAWRNFLHLPALGPDSAASSSRVPAINPRDANAAAAADPRTWTDLHREMKGLLGEARQQLAKRDATSNPQSGSSTTALEAGAAAKRALVRASNLLRALDEGLRDMADAKKLGDGELRRRRDLVASARGERDGLEKVSASISSAARASATWGPVTTADKAALLARSGTSGGTSTSAARRVLGAPLPETERTRELGNTGVVQLQRTQMEEQDQDVEELAKIIRRQKEMGLAINEEVARQTLALENMNDNVDRVGAKLDVAKKKVLKLGK